VCEALFLTYRAVFILAETIENVLRSIYLRGGYGTGSVARNLRGGAVGLGVGFLRAIDLTERMNQVMMIRGYEDRLHGRFAETIGAADALPGALALAAVAFAVVCAVLGGTAVVIALPAALAVAAASGVINYVGRATD
jgi:energy-coupling factor transporter transmembrane protein EcfT